MYKNMQGEQLTTEYLLFTSATRQFLAATAPGKSWAFSKHLQTNGESSMES
jgi:hypothetical protein